MFNVELSVVGHDGHAVVTLCGELGLADAPALVSHLIAAVAACGPSIIVDLAGLDFIDSCGIGVLVRMLKWTRESGGDMSLAAPQQRVRRALSVTGLIDVFSVHPSVEQTVTENERQCQPAGTSVALAAVH
jgi:anti-sigma B factor antagonist